MSSSIKSWKQCIEFRREKPVTQKEKKIRGNSSNHNFSLGQNVVFSTCCTEIIIQKQSSIGLV